MHQQIDVSTRMFRHVTAIAVLLAILTVFAKTGSAQQNLSSAQQTELSQCLVGCKKGDAGCQNGCTQKAAGPDYFKSAGSCVRACADALVGPGENKEQAGDVKTCVQACN